MEAPTLGDVVLFLASLAFLFGTCAWVVYDSKRLWRNYRRERLEALQRHWERQEAYRSWRDEDDG